MLLKLDELEDHPSFYQRTEDDVQMENSNQVNKKKLERKSKNNISFINWTNCNEKFFCRNQK